MSAIRKKWASSDPSLSRGCNEISRSSSGAIRRRYPVCNQRYLVRPTASSGRGVMVSPSGRSRTGSTKVLAGRRETTGLRARARYMAAPWDFPGCAARRGSVGVVLPASSRSERVDEEGSGHAHHRTRYSSAFAEAVAWENGKLKRLGRIDIAARSVGGPCIDFVGERHRGSNRVAEVICPYVKQVVIANPKQVRSSRMRRSRRTRLTSRFLNRAASWRGYALISSRRSVD